LGHRVGLFDGGGDAEVQVGLFWDVVFWDVVLGGVAGTVGLELGGHSGHAFADFLELAFQVVLFGLEKLYFLPFPFSGVVGGQSVALNSLDPALLFLIFGLGSFAGWEVGLGFGEDLAP
jgi:hypothetical protein